MAVLLGLRGHDPEPGYAVSQVAAGGRAVIVLGPLVAAACAWRSSDLATFLGASSRARTRAHGLVRALWPTVLTPALVWLAALLATGAVPDGFRSFWLLGNILVALSACAVAGAVLGLLAPAVMAVPSAALVTFGWLVLGPTAGGSAEYLNSLTSLCCSPSDEPVTAALASTATVHALWVAGLGLLLATRWRRGWLAAGVASVVVAGVVAGSLVAGEVPSLEDDQLAALGLQARSTSPVCLSGSPTVCGWPENRAALDDMQRIVRRAEPAVAALGVHTPTVYSESVTTPPGAGQVDLNGRASERDLQCSWVLGLFPGSDCQDLDAQKARQRLVALVAHESGLDERWLATRLMSDESRQLAQDSGLPVAQRVRLVSQLQAAATAGACG